MTTKVVVTDGLLPIEETRFGFIWGHLVVERVAVNPDGSAVVFVAGTEGAKGVEIRVSPKGRSVRVFRSPLGPELK